MVNFNYVITDEIGIHARPAGLLAKEEWTSKIAALLSPTSFKALL